MQSESTFKNNKKVHFISLGCPKNLVDTEIMLGSLVQDKYEVVDQPEKADTVIVNTCGFIEEAKKESVSTVLDMVNLKNNGKIKTLVVAGCLTQRYKEELVQEIPEADLFVGTGSFQEISKILKNKDAGDTEKKFFNRPTYLQDSSTPRINSQFPHRAYLKISEGCKKRCAFCAIPLIRGNLQSRKISAVIDEAKLLVAGGVKELIVISHDFTDYGWDIKRKNTTAVESPAMLLKGLSEHSDAHWIRVLYLYPDGASDELIQLMKEKKNLVKYFDMPLQHINDKLLKSMNRHMTRKETEKAIQKIRHEIPEAVIRTQFIVGFPGETEADFLELLEFIKEQKFNHVGAFKYSQEEKTAAGKMDQQVSEEDKNRRYDLLMSAQLKISREKLSQYVGKVLEVVVEGVSEESDLLLVGRTSWQAPDIDGKVLINEGQANVGDFVSVLITANHDYDLGGEICPPPPPTLQD